MVARSGQEAAHDLPCIARSSLGSINSLNAAQMNPVIAVRGDVAAAIRQNKKARYQKGNGLDLILVPER